MVRSVSTLYITSQAKERSVGETGSSLRQLWRRNEMTSDSRARCPVISGSPSTPRAIASCHSEKERPLGSTRAKSDGRNGVASSAGCLAAT